MRDKLWWWLVPVIVLCGLAAGFYFTHRVRDGGDLPVASVAQVENNSPAPAEIQHPVPQTASDVPLPSLNESDAPVLQALAGLIGETSVEQLFVPTQLVRHIVVTVDNLPRKKVAPQALPVKPVAGAFMAADSGGTLTIDPKNAARYALWMKLIESLDTQQLAALYFRFYPLFQEAYRNLGYPNGYFNDRLVEAIDDALAAPESTGPIELVQPSVIYQYANSDLEARSAGQKVLLRMGNENAKKLKGKLRELRAAIAR